MVNFYGNVNLFKGVSFCLEIGFDNNYSFNKVFYFIYDWGVLVNNEN